MKALIVIDMQNDFVDGSLCNPDAQAIVKEIASLINSFDGEIIATRDTHNENYLETSEGKHLPIVHCVHSTHGWEITPEIANALKDKNALILDKPTFGFLGWNGFEKYEEVTLVGTCTDICVLSNALILKAKYPDLAIKVLKDFCAGTTKENHEAALKVMACCQIRIV